VWFLVDELVDPELELPLSTVIRSLCRRDIRLLFQQRFVDVDLGSRYGRHLEDGGKGEMRGLPARGVVRQTA
jgi:hypothetical protein